MTVFILITTFIFCSGILMWGAWVYDQSFIYDHIPETDSERTCRSLKRRIQEAEFKFGRYS